MNPNIKCYPLEKLILMGIDRIGYKSYYRNTVNVCRLVDLCRYGEKDLKTLEDFEMFYSVTVKCIWLKGSEDDAEADNEDGASTRII